MITEVGAKEGVGNKESLALDVPMLRPNRSEAQSGERKENEVDKHDHDDGGCEVEKEKEDKGAKGEKDDGE